MSGSVTDRQAVRLPWGLLGMLALVVAVEASIIGLRDDLITPLGDSWRFAAMASEAQAPGCDVLCLGDSLVKYGVLPKVIEARTGLRTYGLAISGGTTPSAYFLLRRAVDAGARPRAIVVDFATLMPASHGRSGLLNYPELATVRDCLDLAWTSNDPGFFAASMLDKLLPSSRYRYEIRNGVRVALEGRAASERASVVSHRRVWTRERGAQPTEPGRAHHPQERSLIDQVCPETWACPSVDEAYIDRFLDLASSVGITVYWLLPPLSPEVRDLRIARGSDAIYDRFVRTVAARHPNAVVLDGRGVGHDDQVHVDHLHLDRRGASVLSADVASVLGDRSLVRSPGNPPWIDLPSFAGRGGDEPTLAASRPRPSANRRSLGEPR